MGRLGAGMVVASETCALDLVGAAIACELEPGDFVRIEDGQVTELPRLSPRPVSRCVFELVYFARPDSTVFGESVDRVRRELGRQLAREQPAPAATWSSACRTAPTPWRSASPRCPGIKLEYGLIRNHYVGRTFINPTQNHRVAKVKIKFNPVRDVIDGKSVVVVDDSLVRGNTSKEPGADDPRRRRARGAPPPGLAADHRPLPLRHRHPDPRGADRLDPLDRGDPRVPRRGLARLPLAGRDAERGRQRTPASATRASRASTPPRFRRTWCSCGTPPRSSRRPHERPLHPAAGLLLRAGPRPTAPPP